MNISKSTSIMCQNGFELHWKAGRCFKNCTVTTFKETLSVLLSVYIWPGTERSRKPRVVWDISGGAAGRTMPQHKQVSCLGFPRSELQTPVASTCDNQKTSKTLASSSLIQKHLTRWDFPPYFSSGKRGNIQECDEMWLNRTFTL